MALENLFANHIGARGGNHEPQRQNNALLYITGLNSAVQGGGQGSGGQDDVLLLSLRTFPVPKRQVGIVEIGYLNEKRKFAGNPTYDDLSVVYQDYVDRQVHSVLWKWNYLVHNPENGQTGLARDYKMAGWVSLFSPEGTIERRLDLVGIWPNSYDPGDIDMDGEDALRVTMGLVIDKVIPRDGLRPVGNQ